MKKLILSLLILAIIISPVFAYSSTVVAPDDKAFEIITFSTEADNSGIIEITQANGDMLGATWSYTGSFPATARVQLPDTDEIYMGFFTPGNMNFGLWGTGNVSNYNKIKMGFGQSITYNRVAETDVNPSPIISYTITSDNPVTDNYVFIGRDTAEQAASPEAGTDMLTKLKESLDAIVGMFLSLLWWLKFLFVDNLLLIFALYFTGTMAYAANTSRNIFQFYKTWFRQQRLIFEFLSNGLSAVVSIATNTIQAVLKWI